MFESSIERLTQLNSQLDQHILQLEDEDKQAEHQHYGRASALEEDFMALQGAFEDLEGGITEVGATAIRVGEQLEIVDKQRSRGSEAKDLIRYYLEFAQGKGGGAERLEELRAKGPDSQFEVILLCNYRQQ